MSTNSKSHTRFIHLKSHCGLKDFIRLRRREKLMAMAMAKSRIVAVRFVVDERLIPIQSISIMRNEKRPRPSGNANPKHSVSMNSVEMRLMTRKKKKKRSIKPIVCIVSRILISHQGAVHWQNADIITRRNVIRQFVDVPAVHNGHVCDFH